MNKTRAHLAEHNLRVDLTDICFDVIYRLIVLS